MKLTAELPLMTNVWLTRTNPSAQESAVVWRGAGFDPILEPLLEISAVPHDQISKDAVLIFTSKNAVDYLECQGQRAICVGDATAEKARDAGFSDVISVDGTSEDVTHWVEQNIKASQLICHISGWHVRGSIVEDLSTAGYSAQRVKVYRSSARPIWPRQPFLRVALYSPLAAKVFAGEASSRDVSAITAVCISQAAADELSGLALKSLHVAARPREDELIMAAKSS